MNQKGDEKGESRGLLFSNFIIGGQFSSSCFLYSVAGKQKHPLSMLFIEHSQHF